MSTNATHTFCCHNPVTVLLAVSNGSTAAPPTPPISPPPRVRSAPARARISRRARHRGTLQQLNQPRCKFICRTRTESAVAVAQQHRIAAGRVARTEQHRRPERRRLDHRMQSRRVKSAADVGDIRERVQIAEHADAIDDHDIRGRRGRAREHRATKPGVRCPARDGVRVCRDRFVRRDDQPCVRHPLAHGTPCRRAAAFRQRATSTQRRAWRRSVFERRDQRALLFGCRCARPRFIVARIAGNGRCDRRARRAAAGGHRLRWKSPRPHRVRGTHRADQQRRIAERRPDSSASVAETMPSATPRSAAISVSRGHTSSLL